MDGEHAAAEDLIRQARDGDAEALGRLLEAHRDALLRRAGRQLGGRLQSRVGSSDVLQLTFLQAARGFAEFRGSTAPELAAWLQRILDRNLGEVVRDHVRLQKRAVGREQSLDAAAGPGPPAEQSSPSQQAARGEEADRLERALQTLPADQREAVRLRHLEGWPLAEIADRMGRSPAAVAGLLKRGLQALRERLKQPE